MKEKVIAIFDVGKTNKKLLLFNFNLDLVSEEETRFPELLDDDGFECDNIDLIEHWVRDSLLKLASSDKIDLLAVNFTTYGATIVCLDAEGKRITPAYNYLKPVDERIPERIYRRYGGQDEFCRRTASPALGMLNSGIQMLWLKTEKPAVFEKVRYILHLPQYLSYLVSGKICSDHTSIGCHTALWDFDNMKYHQWVSDSGLELPVPVPVTTLTDVTIADKVIKVGIGIHDSSSSLAPYFSASNSNFLLISTGTWCINMNPFNHEKLSVEQLDRDCLCYMSINQQPVKSSRIFLGHMHELAVNMLNDHFRTTGDFYKTVRFDRELLQMLSERYTGDKRAFFNSGHESREFRDHIDLFDFKSFDEAYHQLMSELCSLNAEAVRLILTENDGIENIFITGGFARNQIYLKLMAKSFSDKKVYTSVIKNATALGAAIVVLNSLITDMPALNLGLTEYQT